MTILLSDLKKDSNAFFNKFIDPEMRAKQLAALAYIENMARISATNISDWDMGALFFTEDKHRLIEHKGTLNMRLAKMGENLNAGVDKVLSENERAMIKALQESAERSKTRRLNDFGENRRGALQAAASYYANFEQKLTLAHKYFVDEQDLRQIDFGKEMTTRVAKICMNKFYKLVRVEECYAHFETTTPVVLEWKNTSAGINFAVPMGYYKVRINFVWGGIKVLKHKDNIDNARGFWHPYISDQGTVCWGNAADTAADFLHKAQWDMVFDLLHGLLTTYSPDATPYMSLDRFDYYKKLNDKRGSEPAPNCPRCDRQLEINPNTGLTRPCLCFECPSCGDHVEHTAAGRCPNCYCRLCEENRGCEICEDCDNHSGDCSCENET